MIKRAIIAFSLVLISSVAFASNPSSVKTFEKTAQYPLDIKIINHSGCDLMYQNATGYFATHVTPPNLVNKSQAYYHPSLTVSEGTIENWLGSIRFT